jgi:hypothetical protein
MPPSRDVLLRPETLYLTVLNCTNRHFNNVNQATFFIGRATNKELANHAQVIRGPRFK